MYFRIDIIIHFLVLKEFKNLSLSMFKILYGLSTFLLIIKILLINIRTQHQIEQTLYPPMKGCREPKKSFTCKFNKTPHKSFDTPRVPVD